MNEGQTIDVAVTTPTGYNKRIVFDINEILTYEDLLYKLIKIFTLFNIDKISIMLSQIFLSINSNNYEEIIPIYDANEYYSKIISDYERNDQMVIIVHIDNLNDQENDDQYRLQAAEIFYSILQISENIEQNLKQDSKINNIAIFKKCFDFIQDTEIKINKIKKSQIVNQEVMNILVIYNNIARLL
jgi:hypothetical protein